MSGSSLEINGGLLSNSGTVTWKDCQIYTTGNNAIINNLANAVFDLQSANDITYEDHGSNGLINNSGTFRKSAGTGNAFIDWTFNNAGTVEVKSGALLLTGGGDSAGIFKISSGTTLEFSGFSQFNLEGVTFENAGTVRFNTYEVNFFEPLLLSGKIQIDAGYVNLNTANLTGNLTMTSGWLTGIGNVTLTELNWSGGTMSGCGVTQVNGVSTLSRANTLDARTFVNNGTANVVGNAIVYGKDAAVFNNLAGKLVDLQGDGDFRYWSGQTSTFKNAGTLRKATGTGVSIIDWIFQNTGKVDVQSGTIELRKPDNALSGEFDIAPGASLNFVNKDAFYNFLGATINNAGTLSFSNVFGVADNNTNLNNSGTIKIQDGSNIYLYGGIEGSGATILSGNGSTLTADHIYQNTLSIGAGTIVIIAPLLGRPLGSGNYLPVPEPSAWLLLLLAGIIAGYRYQKIYKW